MKTRGGSYDVRYQVKQFVAVVRGSFARFMVFETGDPKFYFFQQIDADGNATALQWPVEKSRLRDDLRRSLRHGVGNAHGGRDTV